MICKKVYIEYPLGKDWQSENKQKIDFVSSLIKANQELGHEIVCIPTPYPCYGVSRLTPDYLLISFHSFNNPNGVLSYKEAPINGLFSLDLKGYSGWSDISINYERYKKAIDNVSQKSITTTLTKFQNQLLSGDSKHPQKNIIENLPKEYILFPLQVRTDSVADHANMDMLDVLKHLSELSKKYKKHLVVKAHPFCNSEALKLMLFTESQDNLYFHISNSNIINLINNSYRVVSCNSGVSLEALILEKDVYCFGKSEWYEITNRLISFKDLDGVFLDSKKNHLTDYQKKYLTYLLESYWVKYDDIQHIKKIVKNSIDGLKSSLTINEQEDLYSTLTRSLLDKQKELTEAENRIKLIEKDFKYLESFFYFFRKKPRKLIKLFFTRIINKFLGKS